MLSMAKRPSSPIRVASCCLGTTHPDVVGPVCVEPPHRSERVHHEPGVARDRQVQDEVEDAQRLADPVDARGNHAPWSRRTWGKKKNVGKIYMGKWKKKKVGKRKRLLSLLVRVFLLGIKWCKDMTSSFLPSLLPCSLARLLPTDSRSLLPC